MNFFLRGNSSVTIPHELHHPKSRKLHGCADASNASCGKGDLGRNAHELSQWLWEFGLGKPRLGGLSAEKTEERRIAVMQNGAKCGYTRDSLGRSRKVPKAAAAPTVSEP